MTTHTRTKEISAATVYIENRLNQALPISEIAVEVGLSPFHFQRLFFAGLGETVAEYIKRRRLEKAAKILSEDLSRSVIDIALETGFETHSAFSRAFKIQFGQTPSAFRDSVGIGARYSNTNNRPFLLPMREKRLDIAVDLIELPMLWLLYREQIGVVNGSYFPKAERLQSEFAELAANSGEGFWSNCGAYRGGPSAFSDDCAIGCYGGLFNREPPLSWSKLCEPLAAGTWAVFPHYGDFQHLYLTWNKLIRNWLPSSGFELRDSWAFEAYLARPGKIDPQVASAQIYFPIR